MQKLLLDGIGLTLSDMRRLARWHGRVINPALANASASRMVAQRIAIKKAAKRREDQKAKAALDMVLFPATISYIGQGPHLCICRALKHLRHIHDPNPFPDSNAFGSFLPEAA